MSNSSFTAPAPIAIDGPAASGKSTVGAALATRYGFLVLDTGATYRAFTLAALQQGIRSREKVRCAALAASLRMEVHGEGETRISLDGLDVTERLREPAIEHNVSAFSAIPGVRTVLVELQRRIASTQPAIVIGRDIGTVVLPDAPVKLFLTASDDSRAQRRAIQSSQWGTSQESAVARTDIEQRDRTDRSRRTSPLKAAPDAIVIDTTDMTLDEVIARAIEVVECRSA